MIRLDPNALGFMNRGIKNSSALRPYPSVSVQRAVGSTPARFVASNAHLLPGV